MPRLKVYDLATGTWQYAGGVNPVALATDVAFTSRFASATQGAGAPAGTGTLGAWYTDTTNKRFYRSDGAGWIIMDEPTQTYVPTLYQNGVRASTTDYSAFRRSGGWVTGQLRVGCNAAGAAGVALYVNAPIGMKYGSGVPMGTFWYQIAGSSVRYTGAIYGSGDFFYGQSDGATSFIGNNPSFAMASSDYYMLSYHYEMLTRYS